MKVLKHNIKITSNYIKISLCKCNCGNILEIQNSRIKTQKFCIKCQKNSSVKHNMSYSKFYRIWADVKTRGLNRYNIKVLPVGLSKDWHKFENFYGDMYKSYLIHKNKYGERNTTIDRIDNSKGYSKENCRWATTLVQGVNRSVTIYIGGITLKDYCKKYKINYATGYQRYRKGRI